MSTEIVYLGEMGHLRGGFRGKVFQAATEREKQEHHVLQAEVFALVETAVWIQTYVSWCMPVQELKLTIKDLIC